MDLYFKGGIKFMIISTVTLAKFTTLELNIISDSEKPRLSGRGFQSLTL
mgnify:CR=1 FL=1